MNVILVIFWLALLLIFYTYLLYPLLLFVRSKLYPLPHETGEEMPSVTLVVAAYNEVDVIEEKIENILQLDYPRDRLQIIIASDGSDDGTPERIAPYVGQGIQLLDLPRQGKAAAMNQAVAEATGDILVFSDANSLYARDAIRHLVAPFSDPTVGGVAGDQCYLQEGVGITENPGESTYWNFDRLVKRWQSDAGSATSATGAIYAMRRSLFEPIIEGVTDDFYTSTNVIRQHQRLIFVCEAKSYEPVAPSSEAEFRRKVRIITRGLTALIARKELLNPFRYGFYSLQLVSHKVLRRLVVFPLLVLYILNPFLCSHGPFYQGILLAQWGFYGIALAGAVLPVGRIHKLAGLPFFFCMVNFAALVASLRVMSGQRIQKWKPQREVSPAIKKRNG